MKTCLDHDTDWVALAKNGNYCATKLASACGMSPRQLERRFHAMGRPAPHHWLRALRMSQAVEMMSCRTPLKVVAIDLGYKDPSHFAHDFKGYFGVCPSSFGQNPPLGDVGGKIGIQFPSALNRGGRMASHRTGGSHEEN
jgi:AraC-like DNA-binding protein